MNTFFKDSGYYRQRLTAIAGSQQEYAFTVKKEGGAFIINANTNYFESTSFVTNTRNDWRTSYKTVVTFGKNGLKLDVTINKITRILWLSLFITFCLLLLKDSTLLFMPLFQLGTGVPILMLKRRYRKRVTDFLNNI